MGRLGSLSRPGQRVVYRCRFILFWAFLFSTLAGIALALVLVLSYPAGLRPCAVVYHVVDTVVNLVRSTPFIILIVTLMPLMRLIFGSAIGIPAAVFAISVHGCTAVAGVVGAGGVGSVAIAYG